MEHTFEPPALSKRVGLITGVFERIDAATVQGLKEARARCDKLVIGLDANPTATFLARKSVLDALGYTNSIFTYGNDSEYQQALRDLGRYERLDHLIDLKAA